MKIFGSVGYVNISDLFQKKFDSKAEKIILVGYERESENNNVYNPNKKTITVTRHVIFNEVDQKAAEEESNS